MNPTDPTAGSAPGSALPQKTGETRANHEPADGCERWDREGGYCIEGADCSCRPARYVCLAGCGYRSDTLTPRAGTLGRLGYTIPTCPDCGHSLGVSADWWAS